MLGFALAMRLVLVGEEPLLSTDLYRYIWDGRVQAAGINPYLHVPADPALAALRDAAIYPRINRADYAVTAYPPVAQMFFFAVTRIAETVMAMRLAMVACEIVIVVVVIDLLRRLALPVTAVVAYAWHPLAIWEIANNGHAEALMVALLMLGVWLLVRAHRVAGAVAVALAALVKPYAVLVFPAFWRPWDWRVPLAIVATISLCYLPYLGAGARRARLSRRLSRPKKGSPAAAASGWSRCCRPCSARCLAHRRSMRPLAAAIMIVLGLRHRFDPDAHAARDDLRRHRAAHRRTGADVAELRLVFPRAGAVHSARRGRAPRGR